MAESLIEVFILTYNRVLMLETAVRSVLSQTAATKLTVVDNHSTDGTVEMISRLKDEGCEFEYIRRAENGGAGANFETARANFRAPYVMVFHDDDVLHPQYIESALAVLREHPELDLICSSVRDFSEDAELDQRQFERVEYKFFPNRQRFASYVYCASILNGAETLHYSPTIYRRDYLQHAVGDGERFGKIADTPFMVECVHDGAVVQMTTPMAWIRRHAGQDTKNPMTGCSIEQILNISRYYREYMMQKPDSARLYGWVCGRGIRAGINFSTGKFSTLALFRAAIKAGLVRFHSFFLLGEYVLGRFLHLPIPIHHWLWNKKVAALYTKGELNLL